MLNRFARRYLLASVLALTIALPSRARASSSARSYFRDPSYIIDTWESDDGLPENSATAMVQDADGYLWFGTFGGLVRFDGVKFDVFDPTNTPQLPSAGIVNLHIDATGRLWVSTIDGVASLWRGRWRRYGPGDGWVGNYARSIVERKNGDLLFATFDGRLLEFRGDRFHELPRPATPGLGCFATVDELGQWWVVQGGMVARLRGETWENPLPFNQAVAAEQIACTRARDGGVWVLQRSDLIKFQNGREVTRRKLSFTPNYVWSISEDSNGNVWIAGQGVARISPKGDVQRWTVADGLSAERMRFVFEDREGNVWIGTNGGGLQRFRPRRFNGIGRADGLLEPVVNSITADGAGSAIAATYGAGLFRIHGRDVKPLPPIAADPQCAQSVMVDRAGNTWAGIFGYGLFVVPKTGPTQNFPIEQTGGSNIIALFEDSRGRVWAGGSKIVIVCDPAPAGQSFVARTAAACENVCYFAEDGDGAIWMTNRRTVHRLDRDGKLVEVFDQDRKPIVGVSCLKSEPDGSIWLGGARGLSLFRQGRNIDIESTAQLDTHGVSAILDDEDGHLWLTSSRGILRIAKRDLLASELTPPARPLDVQTFDQSDGLPARDGAAARQPNCARDARGTLWFTSPKGVASVQVREMRVNTRPASIRIQSMTFEPQEKASRPAPPRQSVDVSSSSSSSSGAQEIALGAGSHRFEIQFTALSLGAPQKVQFQTRLDGSDTNWQPATTARTVAYQDLLPGHYVFRVRASNDDGVWSADEATVAFAIAPFFWQTGWFWGAVGLTLVSGGALVTWAALHARHKRVHERMLLREQRHELVHLSRVSMLGEISGSLTHELGQPLTAIRCNAEAARTFLESDQLDRAELREILNDILSDDRRASEIIDRLRPLFRRGEVQPEPLDLNGAVADVLKIVSHDLAAHGITARAELAPNLPPALVNRVQLQQVLINLIFNARDAMTTVNESGPNFVAVSNRANNGETNSSRTLFITTQRSADDVAGGKAALQVSVTDHGHGIPPDRLKEIFNPFFTTKRDGLGLGLSLCQSILTAHKGRLWATNNPATGASFHFTLPMA